MRIPPSVFVMSLVTAVPFSLAIKDTLHPPKTRAQIEEEKERQYEADMERQAQADREAEAQRTKAVFGTLLGDKAKLGPFLDGIAPGAPDDKADEIVNRTQNASDLLKFSYTHQGDTVATITLSSDDCTNLEGAIRKAWGDGTAWLDTAGHVRASFDADACELTFARYVEIEQFLDKTLTASIPVGALGKPIEQLPGADGYEAINTTGLANTGVPNIRFTTDDADKIVGLSATFPADVDADATIRARLDKVLGKGVQDPETGEWDYKGKIPAHYAYSSARVYLDIGRP